MDPQVKALAEAQIRAQEQILKQAIGAANQAQGAIDALNGLLRSLEEAEQISNNDKPVQHD